MEDEAAGLKKKIADDTAYINDNAEKSKDVDDFVKFISGFESVTALDSELLHTLIDKIIVHEYKNTDGGKSMRIEIYYRFIRLQIYKKYRRGEPCGFCQRQESRLIRQKRRIKPESAQWALFFKRVSLKKLTRYRKPCVINRLA